MKTLKTLLFAVAMMIATTTMAAPSVYTKTIDESYESYMPKFKQALKRNHMNVVSELDLLDRFNKVKGAEKYREGFDGQGIRKITSLVTCIGLVGIQVASKDPSMMALCPVRITVMAKGEKTVVTFIRNQYIAKGSVVEYTVARLDNAIIDTVELLESGYMQKMYKEEVTSYKSQFED
jgi:uncharacterized protein (DUF302 family)